MEAAARMKAAALVMILCVSCAFSDRDVKILPGQSGPDDGVWVEIDTRYRSELFGDKRRTWGVYHCVPQPMPKCVRATFETTDGSPSMP